MFWCFTGEMDELQLLSNKSAPLKCVAGYIHRRKRKYNDREYWVCIESNCRGKITTMNGEVVSGPKDHYHEPSSSEYVSRKQRNLVKADAIQNPSEMSREIYDTANSELIDKLLLNRDLISTHLKTFNGLKATISRAKRFGFPPLPSTISELSIQDDFKISRKGENYYSLTV